MRANIYVDGFNLYYGLRKSRYKWLDIGALCRLKLPTHTINQIRYFTANVKARPHDPGQPVRQQTYLRALKTTPNLSIKLGHFLTKDIWMPRTACLSFHLDNVQVCKTEEKGSDVNLASYLLLDGFHRDFEIAFVVTNDSDLCEPIRMVTRELGLLVGVLNPHHYLKRSRALFNAASSFDQITLADLAACQFPPTLTDRKGAFTRPATW